MGSLLQNAVLHQCKPQGLTSHAWKTVPTSAPLHRLQIPSGHFHQFHHGALLGLQMDICSPMDNHGLQRNNLHSHEVCQGLQGTFYSSLLFLTDLGVCKLFPSCLLTPLSQFALCSALYPFLHMLSQNHYQCHWKSQLALGAGCNSFCQTWKDKFLTEVTFASLSLPKPCHVSWVQGIKILTQSTLYLPVPRICLRYSRSFQLVLDTCTKAIIQSL